jgi:adenosylcobinamide kinase/adenosylcobinamide-phosphate guanylyltransferase
MSLTVILGGARSGKSRLAQDLVGGTKREVVFIATATPGDEEMAARIDHHRRERPSHWVTIEEPLDLSHTLVRVAPEATVIVDCLTLWLANVMAAGWETSAIVADATRAAATAVARAGETIVVSNEVGMGVVPPSSLGRAFRDLAGRVNQIWVGAADRAGLVVAGRVLPLVELPQWISRRREMENDT